MRASLCSLFILLRDRSIEAGIIALDYDGRKANEFIANHEHIENEIGRYQVDCEVAIARFQPVARDLRDIMVLFRIGHELERVLALTLSVVKKTVKIIERFEVDNRKRMFNRIELIDQVGRVESMLKCCQLLTISYQPHLVDRIKQSNDEVGLIKRRLRQEVNAAVASDPNKAGLMFYMFAVCRHYDSIADLLYSVSEEIVALKS
ncbi:MAG: hypothetical protein OYH77_02310 [Pseudomonadota bacterium]|nr:hypothetical protein [Pseudomonadota bacterium]